MNNQNQNNEEEVFIPSTDYLLELFLDDYYHLNYSADCQCDICQAQKEKEN